MHFPKNELQLFPYLLLRYATGHHQALSALRIMDINTLLSASTALTAQINTLKSNLCDQLFEQIKLAPETANKQLLLNIKRDVYNNRAISEAQVHHFNGVLSADMRALLLTFIRLQEQQQRLQENWQHTYRHGLQQNRVLLQEAAGNELFRKGMLLSSQSLSDQLEMKVSGHKERKQEYSLLRYLGRMYFKTSPFSTFTHLGIADAQSLESLYEPVRHPDKIHSHIRLNNDILEYLKTLLSHHPAINEHLLVRLNPTITLAGAQVRFLVNVSNLESFQQLPATELVPVLIELLQQPLQLGALMAVLMEEYVDSGKPDLKKYLLKLWEVGLFEFDLQASGLDPDWNASLQRYLQPLSHHHLLIGQTIETLQLLQVCCQTYAHAALPQRKALLTDIHTHLNALFNRFLHDTGGFANNGEDARANYMEAVKQGTFGKKPYFLSTIHAQKLIYEDTCIKEAAAIDAAAVKEIVTLVEALCTLLGSMDPMQEERNRMRDFFITAYGEAQPVSLLTFYYDYYQKIKKPLQEANAANNTGVEDVHRQAYQQTYRKWVNEFKKVAASLLSPTGDTLNISPADLLPLQVHFPPAAGNPVYARAMFAQLFLQEENGEKKLCGVVNSVFQGMGKVAGRFLHLFDPAVTQQLQHYNHHSNPQAMLMELTDVSCFNANIHPPLLAFELRAPDGQNSLPPAQQVAVKDIQVCFDREKQQLCLQHTPTGRSIIPFDLCLQAFQRRSKLYQLLTYFSADQAIGFRPIQVAVNELLGEKYPHTGAAIRCFPRITYAGKVVIKRRGWTVPLSCLPAKTPQQNDADHFMAINQWRISQGIPTQVFLLLRPRAAGNDPVKKDQAADDYKPQYICFDSPLFMLLWNKLLTRAGERLYLEEMLPDTDILKENPVNEALIHWYCYA